MAKVVFDEPNDVLYVTFADVPASRGVESPAGVIRRFDSGGTLVGITILDFAHRLLGQNESLLSLVNK